MPKMPKIKQKKFLASNLSHFFGLKEFFLF